MSETNTAKRNYIQQKWIKAKNNLLTLNKLYKTWEMHRLYTLDILDKKFKSGQKKYAVEYMKQHSKKMVKQGDLLKYCDERRCQDTAGKKPNFKDNSRGIEQLRKDVLPLSWIEKKINGELYFIYIPELKDLISDEIINNTKHKNQGFPKEIIQSKSSECNFKCELTGLPVSEGHLAGDHWNPKEGGGISDPINCIIINKILNEKKNKHPPVEWFCKSLLTNFLTICNKTGMNMGDVKDKLITFIQEF